MSAPCLTVLMTLCLGACLLVAVSDGSDSPREHVDGQSRGLMHWFTRKLIHTDAPLTHEPLHGRLRMSTSSECEYVQTRVHVCAPPTYHVVYRRCGRNMHHGRMHRGWWVDDGIVNLGAAWPAYGLHQRVRKVHRYEHRLTVLYPTNTRIQFPYSQSGCHAKRAKPCFESIPRSKRTLPSGLCQRHSHSLETD